MSPRGYDINPFDMPEPDAEIHRDWTMRQYLEHPGKSRSTLWLYAGDNTSPKEARWAEENRSDAESDAMRLGTAIHTAVLEPHLFDAEVVEWTGKTRNGKAWDEFQAEHAGKCILTKTQWPQAELVRDYALTLKGPRKMIAQGDVEVVILWTDPLTGQRCKVRLDFLALDEKTKQAVVFDLKTTRHNLHNPWALMRDARDHGYYLQAAMAKVALAALGYTLRDYYHFWLSTTGAPTSRMTYLLPDAIEEGEETFRATLDLYHSCESSGDWPGPKWPKDDPLPYEVNLK